MNEPNWKLPPHPCATCGAPTVFYRCDECFYGSRKARHRGQFSWGHPKKQQPQPPELRQREPEPPSAPPEPPAQRAPERQWLGMARETTPGTLPTAPTTAGTTATEFARLFASEELNAFEKFVVGAIRGRALRGLIGGPDDGDEFGRTLRALAETKASMPQAREWWGMCPWCARELRERSGDEVSYLPASLARIRFCERHRMALFRWTLAQRRDQADEELAQLFTAAYGFGDGERKGEIA